jgi:hypothetical protein
MSRIMPAMADGRCMTSYVPACAYDFHMQKKFNVMGNARYRAFLQNSAPTVYSETRKLHVCALNPRFVDGRSGATGRPARAGARAASRSPTR